MYIYIYIYIYIYTYISVFDGDKIEDNAIGIFPYTDVAGYVRSKRATVRVRPYVDGRIQSNSDDLFCNERTSLRTL